MVRSTDALPSSVHVAGVDGSIIKPTPVKSPLKQNTANTNGSVRHNDVINHKHQTSLGSVTSEEKKLSRVSELNIPTNLKPDDSKYSPTSSISSTMSSHSRISTSSNASRPDNEGDDHPETRPHVRSGRRKQITVAPTFLRRLSSTQVLEGGRKWGVLKCFILVWPIKSFTAWVTSAIPSNLMV